MALLRQRGQYSNVQLEVDEKKFKLDFTEAKKNAKTFKVGVAENS